MLNDIYIYISSHKYLNTYVFNFVNFIVNKVTNNILMKN